VTQYLLSVMLAISCAQLLLDSDDRKRKSLNFRGCSA